MPKKDHFNVDYMNCVGDTAEETADNIMDRVDNNLTFECLVTGDMHQHFAPERQVTEDNFEERLTEYAEYVAKCLHSHNPDGTLDLGKPMKQEDLNPEPWKSW